jgi:hypothetical protein
MPPGSGETEPTPSVIRNVLEGGLIFTIVGHESKITSYEQRDN